MVEGFATVKASDMEMDTFVFIIAMLIIGTVGAMLVLNSLVSSQWERVADHALRQAQMTSGRNLDDAYLAAQQAADDANGNSRTQTIEYNGGTVTISVIR